MTPSPSYLDKIRDVPDFPKPGIVFKDITPLLADVYAFMEAIEDLVAGVRGLKPTHVAGVESRGFLLAGPMAERLGVGVIPLRKPGKLPCETWKEDYSLEYGEATLEIHRDACGPTDRVVVVDDLLATGGTVAACNRLLIEAGAEVVGCAVVIELEGLGGREALAGCEVTTLMTYSEDE